MSGYEKGGTRFHMYTCTKALDNSVFEFCMYTCGVEFMPAYV